MAWIWIPDDVDANEELRTARDQVRSSRGEVANIMAVHGLKPTTMLAHLGLYRDIMFGKSELSRAEREAVAVAVSA